MVRAAGLTRFLSYHTTMRLTAYGIRSLTLAPSVRNSRSKCRQGVFRNAVPDSTSAAGNKPAEQNVIKSVMDYADRELQELCSARPTPEEQEKCWQVYEYYHEKREQAQEGCSLELHSKGQEGSACQDLDSLGRLVWEVSFSGNTEQLRHVLEAERSLAQKHAAGLEVNASSDVSETESVLERMKAKAMQLFTDVDADGNGIIDREEFLSAMKVLQHALSDSEMEMVFSCVDSTGYITPEQFIYVVQAGALKDPNADAAMLHAVPHSRPQWWTDLPHCVSDV